MTAKIIAGSSRNRVAAALMLIAVVGSSLMPLLVAVGGDDSPFLFNMALVIGNGLGSAVILLIAYRQLLFKRSVWRLIGSRILSVPMLIWVISYLDLAFYAWSTQFIDIAISAVLFETWPILLILLTGWLFRRESRYRKLSLRTLLLLGVAFLGVIPVIASQAEGLGSVEGSSLYALTLGIALALVAAALTSLSAFGFRWGADIATELKERVETHAQSALELFGVVVGMVICSAITFPVNLLMGYSRDETLSWESFILGASGGVLTAVFSGFLWRKATLITHDLAIHSMVYLSPVLGLGWLFAFSLVGDVSIGFLLLGAVTIVAANVGIYFSEVAASTREVAELEGEEGDSRSLSNGKD